MATSCPYELVPRFSKEVGENFLRIKQAKSTGRHRNETWGAQIQHCIYALRKVNLPKPVSSKNVDNSP